MVHPILRFADFTPKISLTAFIFLVTACAQATPTATYEPIRVQYSFATQPWLANLKKCAGNEIVESELRAADYQETQTIDLVIRIGQSDSLTNTGYQIGTDDLMIIVNPQNPVRKFTAEQVRQIFTGQILEWQGITGTNSPIQVWVFPAGEDVQQIFEKSILGGSPVTSLARLANSPEEMIRAVSKDANAIGLLTHRWNSEETTEVFTVASGLPGRRRDGMEIQMMPIDPTRKIIVSIIGPHFCVQVMI